MTTNIFHSFSSVALKSLENSDSRIGVRKSEDNNRVHLQSPPGFNTDWSSIKEFLSTLWSASQALVANSAVTQWFLTRWYWTPIHYITSTLLSKLCWKIKIITLLQILWLCFLVSFTNVALLDFLLIMCDCHLAIKIFRQMIGNMKQFTTINCHFRFYFRPF